jgi:N-acetylmuramoyl-L-alanine amidase
MQRAPADAVAMSEIPPSQRNALNHIVRSQRRPWRLAARALALTAAGAVITGCAGTTPRNSTYAGATSPPPGDTAHRSHVASRTDDRRHTKAPRPTSRPHPLSPRPVRRFPSAPLSGKIVGIDPGHNGGNYAHPEFLNTVIWNGRERESCDTTGTETEHGYTEALFNFNVARYLAADLRNDGARVVTTRTTNSGVGPCVDRRAQILNHAHADASIDIHADGGPADGRGVAILEPVADGPNNRVIQSSRRLGADLLHAYRAATGIPNSTYDGTNGIAYRDDLAGLNLTTMPKVLIECVNMRNPIDARLLVSPAFQRRAADAFAAAIVTFLTSRD